MSVIEFKVAQDSESINSTCEGCGFELSGNNRFICIYRDTNIEVSYVSKEDLETFCKIEPLCNMCYLNWMERYEKPIEERLISSVLNIQKWYRKYYLVPPCKECPNGGLGYRKAKKEFFRKLLF